MEETVESVMDEIRRRIELLESSLPGRVDARVSPNSKLPFKGLVSGGY
jgi:hypothetical protein